MIVEGYGFQQEEIIQIDCYEFSLTRLGGEADYVPPHRFGVAWDHRNVPVVAGEDGDGLGWECYVDQKQGGVRWPRAEAVLSCS